MIIGQDTFATVILGGAEESGFTFWLEICPNETTWLLIAPREVTLTRCEDAD